MRTLLFVTILLLINVLAARAQSPNTSTLTPTIRQSTLHDAIQFYYAKRGITFYFRQVRTSLGGEVLEDYEVIDLVNHRNLGSLKNFNAEFKIPVDPVTQVLNYQTLMDSFLLKYNGRFEYVMTMLNRTKEDHTVEMCRKILREILTRNADLQSAAGLGEAYKNNRYFNLQIDTAVAIYTLRTRNTQISDMLSQRTFASNANVADLGGGSSLASNLAQGTAKFLIERANQEINAAFFRRLKNAMENTPELQKLFPEVYKLTSTIETYNFDAALIALKTKLEEDLKNLLANIPTLAELDKYKAMLNEVPELTYFFALCDIMNGIRSEQNAGSIIHKVYISPYVQTPTTIQANILKFSGLLSFSLRDAMLCDENTNAKGWIAPSDLHYDPKVLLEIFNYYIGFLAQAEPAVVFRFTATDSVSLKEFLISKHDHVAEISGFIAGTYESLKTITGEIQIIRKLKLNETDPKFIDEAKFEHYQKIAIEVVNITERTVKFPDLFRTEQRDQILKNTTAFKAVYIPAAEKVLSITANIEKRNYNEAIFKAGELVNILLQKIKDKDEVKLAGNVFKYGQFFASVATAENGDDVKNAIDAIALPTGGSSIKKDLAFNIAVNGYIGYFRRHIKADDAFISGFTQSYGITAPVGFTFSAGMRKGGSISLFTGILDVGAIAQYQLDTDANSGTTTAEPDIEWGNIISPSVSLVYGAPFYLPVSVGIGYQWLANNAKIKDDNYELTPRFNFMIAFDIPVVNIVSVKRSKK